MQGNYSTNICSMHRLNHMILRPGSSFFTPSSQETDWAYSTDPRAHKRLTFSRHNNFVTFYPRDAMLARVIAIATCLSVRPSVTRRYCVKTKKASCMISSPSGSPKTRFSDAKFHHQIIRGSPRTGASNKGRSEKFSDFLALTVNISKTVADTAKVTISD